MSNAVSEQHVDGHAGRIREFHWLGGILFAERIDLGLLHHLARLFQRVGILEETAPEHEHPQEPER
jgi:hypothetical protein